MDTKRCDNCLKVFPAPMVFEVLGLSNETWCAECALKIAAKIVATAPGVAKGLIRDAQAVLARCSIQYLPSRAAMNPGERGI
jgi:hypothetical protein